jgi:outer membrane biosynthesis protein TonB
MRKKALLSTLTAVGMAAVLAVSPLQSIDIKAAPVNTISTTPVAASNIVDLTRNDAYKVRDAFYSLSDNSVNRMASEHFQIIWGKSNSTNIRIDEEFIKGNLTNLENIYAFYTQELGMKDIGVSGNQKFKTNVYISNTGLRAFEDNWAYMNRDREGFGFLFVAPGAMVVSDPNPSWVLPHELAHVFTYYQGGNIDYPWYESTANWFRDQFLGSEYYCYHGKKFGPYSDFFSPYLINADYYVPHMLNWYDTWPIFLYISENPDHIDGLGMELMHKILENKQQDSSMYATIERLSGVSIKTILGGMSKRLATMDFSRQKFYLEHLNNETLREAGNREKIYTTLSRPDNEGYQAVPANKAPMQTGFNIIPLNVDLKKGEIQADFVNTSGVQGSDFRVTLVTSTADDKTRYSETFSSGTGSIALHGDEKSAYLVVCATPDNLKGYHTDWNSKTTETDTRFTYKVKISATDGAAAPVEEKKEEATPEPEKTTEDKGNTEATPEPVNNNDKNDKKEEATPEPEKTSDSKEDNSKKNEAPEQKEDNKKKDNSDVLPTPDNGGNAGNTGSTVDKDTASKSDNSGERVSEALPADEFYKDSNKKSNNKQNNNDSSSNGSTVDDSQRDDNSSQNNNDSNNNNDDWQQDNGNGNGNWQQSDGNDWSWPTPDDNSNGGNGQCGGNTGYNPAPNGPGYTQGCPYGNDWGYDQNTSGYSTEDLDYFLGEDEDSDTSFWGVITHIFKKIFGFK